MKVHLVDGTYELFRAHFGAPPLATPTGAPVGATIGLVRSLLSLLAEAETTHVAVAFDTVIESFRNDLFAGYKAGAGIEPALAAQFALAERAVAALGVVVWPMVEFEADDALAAGAALYGPDVDQVVLCSPDKDLAQCVVGDQVVCLDRRRKITLDDAGVIEKFGVAPASIPDYLALVGDSADGIPGVPRWGAKGTAAVLAHYKHIDAIPPRVEDWAIKVRGAASLSRNLESMREEAALYRRLAVLRTDVPLEETLDDLEWKGADRDAIEALAEDLGSTRLVGWIPTWSD